MSKTIVITGAGGAIGSMCAYLAAQKKYNIVMVYRNSKTACETLAEDLGKMGASVHLVQADICCASDRAKINDTVTALGGMDILINNAGIAHYGAFAQMSDETVSHIISTNLVSHMSLTRLLLPHLLRRQKGAIVNVSSVWGLTGAAGEVAYSAAKAGLDGFTKALAKELAPSHITVNSVAPGVVQSKMLDILNEQEKAALTAQIPMERFADALEIARSILFVAEQDYITGQIISPNGGLVI